MKLLAGRTTDRVTDWMLWRWMEVNGRRDGVRYMTRLYILNTPWFGLKLHWFWGPDPDEACHDHPWWFLSLLLRGWYVEERMTLEHPYLGMMPDERHMMTVHQQWYQRRSWLGSIAFRRAKDIHNIIRVAPGTVTLVLNGPKERSWGFWTKPLPREPERVRFKGWRSYLGIPTSTPEV